MGQYLQSALIGNDHATCTLNVRHKDHTELLRPAHPPCIDLKLIIVM